MFYNSAKRVNYANFRNLGEIGFKGYPFFACRAFKLRACVFCNAKRRFKGKLRECRARTCNQNRQPKQANQKHRIPKPSLTSLKGAKSEISTKEIEKIKVKDSTCSAELKAYKELFKELGK